VLGKTPFGVAQIARRHNTPVVIFAGRVGADASILLDHGVAELVEITPRRTPIEQALRDGAVSLARAAGEFCGRI
jgi:glycerate kinase